MSGYWKAEVLADSSGRYSTNGLCFRTKAEAEAYARDLASRWTLVRDWRVRKATRVELATDVLREVPTS